MTTPFNASSNVPPITEEDIAEFLVNTPDFFERHAEVLSSVTIASPHGQRAVSLHERQAEMLREKIKGLEQRIMDMVRHSSENTGIGDKMHEWVRLLLAVKEPMRLPTAVENGMRDLFDVPQVALRVWGVGPVYSGESFARGVSEDARAFASSLTSPFCGANMGFEPTQWLPQAAQVQSLALLPLWTIVGDWIQVVNTITMSIAVLLTVASGIDYVVTEIRGERRGREATR